MSEEKFAKGLSWSIFLNFMCENEINHTQTKKLSQCIKFVELIIGIPFNENVVSYLRQDKW